jgi:hypothetical protein
MKLIFIRVLTIGHKATPRTGPFHSAAAFVATFFATAFFPTLFLTGAA